MGRRLPRTVLLFSVFSVTLLTLNKKSRISQASSKPMPESEEFLSPFRVHFYRREGQAAMGRYGTVDRYGRG